MAKIQVNCDIDPDASEFVCQVKKDGRVVKTITGKDFEEIDSEIKRM